MRLFLALNLPPDVQAAAHAAAEPLRVVAPGLAWTAADKLHLTVKFFGERPEAEVAALIDALTPVVRQHAPAAIDLAGVGAFPRMRRRPRVLWLGVRPDPKLELLHHDIEASCAALGYPVEGRPFRPHVTLARVRAGAEPVDTHALARAAAAVPFRAAVLAATVDLMQSELAAGGSRYTTLARLPLAGPTPQP